MFGFDALAAVIGRARVVVLMTLSALALVAGMLAAPQAAQAQQATVLMQTSGYVVSTDGGVTWSYGEPGSVVTQKNGNAELAAYAIFSIPAGANYTAVQLGYVAHAYDVSSPISITDASDLNVVSSTSGNQIKAGAVYGTVFASSYGASGTLVLGASAVARMNQIAQSGGGTFKLGFWGQGEAFVAQINSLQLVGTTAPLPPTVTGIAPAVGPFTGGTSATIAGSNFVVGATSVTIGGTTVPAGSVSVNSASSLTFQTPAHAAGNVAVTVTTAGGTSGAVPGGFTYSTSVAPVVTTQPPHPTVAVGQTATFTAAASGAPTVQWQRNEGSGFINLPGATSTTYVTPPTTVSMSGYWYRAVFTNDAGTATTNYGQLTVLTAPSVSSLSPNEGSSGGGTPVSIIGHPFISGQTYTATFGATTVPATYVDGNRLTALAPAGTGTVSVIVTNTRTSQVGTVGAGFTYGPPTVTGLSATSGPSSTTRVVTISGTNFTPTATVSVDGVAATGVTYQNRTQLTATLPGRPAGTYDVRVTTGSVTSAASASSQYVYIAAPVVTSVAPASGSTTGGTSVTLTGANLSGATAVTFAGNAAADVIVAADGLSLTATAPAGSAGAASVAVTTPGGTGQLGGGYTYVALAAPTVTTHPSSLTVASGTPVELTAAASGYPAPTVQWQRSTDGGGTFSNIAVTTATYSFNATLDLNGVQHRAVFTNGSGSATTSAAILTVTAPAPTLSSISPNEGSASAPAAVTITGANFSASGNSVTFGGVAGSITSQSPTSITVTPPANAAGGLVSVVVTTADARSVTMANGYRYLLPPTIALAFSPTTINGAAATNFTITLSNPNAVELEGVSFATFALPTGFTFSSSPQFGCFPGGTSVNPTGFYVTDANLAANASCTVGGNYAQARSGVYTVTSTAPTASGTAANTIALTGVAGTSNSLTVNGLPSVTGVSPNRGPAAGGTVVTLTGANFAGVTGVSFGATPADGFVYNSPTSITATAPAGTAGDVSILVTVPGGTSAASAANRFTYIAAPEVTSISPMEGPLAGGTTVTITGTGLTGATAVAFGGSPATGFTVVNATTVTATSPAGAGTVDVLITGPGGTSATSAADQFTYIAAPEVTSISPTEGPLAGGTTVTITGTGLTGATAVAFGGSPATGFTVVNATTVTATSPAGAGTVDVRITGPGGTSATSAADRFTYAAAPPAPTIGTPTNGQLLANAQPLITGGSQSGSTVSIYIDGALTGAATMGIGTFSYQPSAPLAEGSHTVYAIASGPGGPSQPSATVSFTVDSQPPATPVIDTPTEGQVTPASVTISGTAEALSTVLISINGDAAITRSADSAGGWSLTLANLATGPHVIAVKAQDAAGNQSPIATRNFTVDATPPAAPVVTYPAQNGIVTTADVSATGTAEDGATVTVFLDGVEVGATPASNGSWSFSLANLSQGNHQIAAYATDATGNRGDTSVARLFSVSLLNLVETLLPDARVGTAYSETITATGGQGPLTFTVDAANPPPGLSLASNGALTGTPTQSGTFHFNVRVTDGANSDLATYAVVVDAPTPPTADPETVEVPAPEAGQPALIDLSDSVGNARSIEITTPPPVGTAVVNGLSITYTPPPGYFGDVSFAYRAIGIPNGNGEPPASAPATVTITYAAPTLSMTPASGALPGVEAGQAYSQTFTASGGTAPYTYAVTADALPTGLTLSSDGTLSGSPTSGGTFSFTVTATDNSTGTGPFTTSNTYSLTVSASTITVTPETLPNGARGTAYSQTVTASGGVGAYTYSVSTGALPTGLSLAPATGVISGTPTATGTFTFSLQATDSATGAGPYSGTRSYVVTIASLNLTVTPTTLPTSTFGVAYSQQFTTSGGQGTYGYAVTTGALPTGVTLSTGGLLSGTPLASGTFDFTVTSTDSFGNTGTGALSLTVTARPDPSLDPDVRGLSSAQAQSTRRFAETQIGNITRRLEQLHNGGGAAGHSLNLSLDGGAFTPLNENQLLRPEMGRVMGEGLIERDASGRFEAENLMANRLSARQQDSQSGSGPMGAGPDGEPGRIRVWAGGMISLGERDATTRTANLDIRTSGVSLGADTSLSDTLDVGLGVGFGQEDTDVGDGGSRMEGETWVGVGYLSWRPAQDWFIDAIVGYGQLSFDTTRRTPVDQSMVFGQREGSMVFGSLSTGIDRTVGPVHWSGYGRLEVTEADLDAYAETGSPIWALSFAARDIQSIQTALGVRYARDLSTSSTTVWTPGVRFELSQELGDEGSQSIRYADLQTGPVYAIDQEGWDRMQATLAISLRMRTVSGWSFNGEADTRFGGHEVMTTVRLVAERRF